MTEAIHEAIAETELSFNAIERETGILRQSLMKFAVGEQTLRLDAADTLAAFFGLVVESHRDEGEMPMDSKQRFGVDVVFLPTHAYYGMDGAGFGRYDDFRERCEEGKVEDWTSKKTAELGDIYLFWFGKPISEISGVGVSLGDSERKENNGWDWTDADYGYFGSYSPLISLASPVTLEQIKHDTVLLKWWNGRPFQGKPKSIKSAEVAERLVQLILKSNSKDRELRQTLKRIVER